MENNGIQTKLDEQYVSLNDTSVTRTKLMILINNDVMDKFTKIKNYNQTS